MEYGLKVSVAGRRIHVHRYIVERAIGHPLPSTADVHHVDGDPSNNAHSNLVACQDRAYHQLLHVRARVVRAGGDPNTQRVCGRCGLVKDFADFYPRRDRPGGIAMTRCKSCWATIYRQRKADAA